MKYLSGVATMILASLSSSIVAASPPCPVHEEGVVPWNTPDIVEGDRWAWVYLTINTRGTPTTCGIGENNLSQGARSKVCRSFINNWRATPVLKDGQPISSTIKRRFVIIGKKHEKAYDEARKNYFLQHPEERPDCYPK